jgi:hypothetical protein
VNNAQNTLQLSHNLEVRRIILLTFLCDRESIGIPMLNTKGIRFQYLSKGRESLSNLSSPLPIVKGIGKPSFTTEQELLNPVETSQCEQQAAQVEKSAE